MVTRTSVSLLLKIVSAWISDSKCEKTRTSHDQTHDDNGKETGRSNIFAHDDTYSSIRQISGKPEPRRRETRTNMASQPPVVCQDTIKPQVRFRMSSSDRENDFIATARLLRPSLRTKHLHGTESRRARDRPQSLRSARRAFEMWRASHAATAPGITVAVHPVGRLAWPRQNLRTEEHQPCKTPYSSTCCC